VKNFWLRKISTIDFLKQNGESTFQACGGHSSESNQDLREITSLDSTGRVLNFKILFIFSKIDF
jgi:hypothetical protein